MKKEMIEKICDLLDEVLDRDSQYCGLLSTDARETIRSAVKIAESLKEMETDSLPTRPWRGPEC